MPQRRAQASIDTTTQRRNIATKGKKGDQGKKNLCAQRSLSCSSVDPTARPGFPWVFLCGYQQLERATGGPPASAIQGWGPCLRVPDQEVGISQDGRARLRRPSQFASCALPTAPPRGWPLAG
ncbi:hypothetical protein V8C35DRAFT_307096 [Trichoderma chlorosporum]